MNALGILAGGAVGAATAWQLTPRIQQWLRLMLGTLILFLGFRSCWFALHGGWRQMLATVAVALLALVLGRLVGRALGGQRRSNRFGQWVRNLLVAGAPGVSPRPSEAFIACGGLFCLTPLALLGSVTEGLTGDFGLLLVKGVMEGTAMIALIRQLGWGTLGAALPVLAFQGTVSLGLRAFSAGLLAGAVGDVMIITAGLLTTVTSLLVFEVRRTPAGRPIQVADYLPSLIIAPLLARLLLAGE